MSRTIVLTGAPEKKNLDWNETTLISTPLAAQILIPQGLETSSISATPFSARWRQLLIKNNQMRPVLSEFNLEARANDETDTSQANFFTLKDLTSQTPLNNRDSSNDSYASTKDSEEIASETLSEFYDHSFTMTVNIIVAILSIAEPKTVIAGAKYGKPRETELVEMLVGDDTKSGFSITMWLPREMHVNWKDGAHYIPEGQRSALRRDLKMLRSRDIVLLQNVALSFFNGKVHGQSLRRDVTKVNLLFRKKIDDQDVAGVYSVQSLRNATDSDQQLVKVKKVRDWLLEFVGERKGVIGRRGGRRDILPPDTQ